MFSPAGLLRSDEWQRYYSHDEQKFSVTDANTTLSPSLEDALMAVTYKTKFMAKKGTEWYRNTTFDEHTEEEFRKRLLRAKSDFNRAKYMRVQGLMLLDSPDRNIQEKGINLIKELIDTYPDEESNVMFGHLALGDYYTKINQYAKAIQHYETVYKFNNRDASPQSTYGTPELNIAETAVKSEDPELMEIGRKYLLLIDTRKLFVQPHIDRYNLAVDILLGDSSKHVTPRGFVVKK